MEVIGCLWMNLWCLLGVSLEAAGVNIALGKPAVLGSTWAYSTPDKAVDGSYDNDVSSHHCATSNKALGNWWTVDLQDFYVLDTIIIRQTGGSSYWSIMDDLVVDGFLADPQFYPDAAGSLCAMNTGPSGLNVSLICAADTVARFVRLTGPINEHLILCEVEMYGEKRMMTPDCRSQPVPILLGRTSTTAAVELGSAERRLDCLVMCQRLPTCNVAGYNSVTRMCSKHATPVLTVADVDTTLIYVP